MRRFRAVEIRLRAVDFLPCALHHCFVLMQFVLEFGHLEDGEKLTGPHAIADVHVDGLQVACNLRVHVDFLERPEFCRDRQDLGDVPRQDSRDGHGRQVARPAHRSRLRASRRGERANDHESDCAWNRIRHPRLLTR